MLNARRPRGRDVEDACARPQIGQLAGRGEGRGRLDLDRLGWPQLADWLRSHQAGPALPLIRWMRLCGSTCPSAPSCPNPLREQLPLPVGWATAWGAPPCPATVGTNVGWPQPSATRLVSAALELPRAQHPHAAPGTLPWWTIKELPLLMWRMSAVRGRQGPNVLRRSGPKPPKTPVVPRAA